MRETRRRLLLTMAGIAAGAITQPSALAGQATPHPQPMPSPNAPNPNAPRPASNAPESTTIRRRAPRSIRSPGHKSKADVEELFQMTSQFRDHVAQTNVASTLPLPLIKEAKQIEKLAKQIEERLKG